MRLLHRVARSVRHAPGLRRAEWLWRLVRKPYIRCLDLLGQGTSVRLGGCLARIPAEFSGACLWEEYEPEPVAALVGWVREHPTGLVLDVGCEIGLYSVAALAASPAVEVIAFDADLNALQAARRVCRCMAGSRLRLVYGFLSEGGREEGLETAVEQTTRELARAKVSGDPGTNRHLYLHGPADPVIPTRSLDSLFGQTGGWGRPVLLKSDIEGAELLMLRGAARVLREARPQLLLSVHPLQLPRFGHSVADIREHVQSAGYRVEFLADHGEEHWWCTPV
jgi:FkbM family methyltransferase